jgi:DNA polymerase II large subunit
LKAAKNQNFAAFLFQFSLKTPENQRFGRMAIKLNGACSSCGNFISLEVLKRGFVP